MDYLDYLEVINLVDYDLDFEMAFEGKGYYL